MWSDWTLSFVCVFCTIIHAYSWLPDKYPDYCSKDMSKREIPPLSNEEDRLVDQLIQVQVAIRHGSRTPYKKYSCWKDYDVKWDCNVTEIMFTSPSSIEDSSNWLFRKVYDGSPNSLGGNCETGQLLREGYEQESTNGKILRQAYIGSHKVHLMRSSMWEMNNPRKIYFRSDDEQRTLMSGQILVHSLFDINEQEIIDWHTGDYALDTLYPNDVVCPRLDNITREAFSSKEYLTSSSYLKKAKLGRELDLLFGEGYWSWSVMIDCLMTSVCNDIAIPGGHRNGLEMTANLFNEAYSQEEYDFYFKLTYNNSIYSKLAMSRMSHALRTRIEEAIRGDDKALEFILYAGHDTTIMPLLAILPTAEPWDGRWAPYGALLSFELYRAKNASIKHLFRLVYNGKPLLLHRCKHTLCDINVLLDALSFGTEDIPEACKAIPGLSDIGNEMSSSSTYAYVVVTALISSICSIFCTYIVMRDDRNRLYSKIDDSDGFNAL